MSEQLYDIEWEWIERLNNAPEWKTHKMDIGLNKLQVDRLWHYYHLPYIYKDFTFRIVPHKEVINDSSK